MTIRALLLLIMIAIPSVASAMTGSGRGGLHYRAHYYGWELVVLPSDEATEFALLSGRRNKDDEDSTVPHLTLSQLEDRLNRMRPRSVVSVHYYEQRLAKPDAAVLPAHLRDVCRSNRLRCVFAI